MSTPAAVGQFVAWDGGCLFLGRTPPQSAVMRVHAHYAIQIAFGSEHGIRFRATEREDWAEYGAVVIPSRQPHAMDASRVGASAVLFVEPETREGRALTERWLSRGQIIELPEELLLDSGAALFAAWSAHRTERAIAEAARAVVQTLTDGVLPSVVADERILRAIAYVRSHLDQPLSLEEVAAEACLSPSRFRHLFVEQTGMALRQYILWRRFLRVWEILMSGASLSVAAHEAGFADAPHLTRTCRQMFGLAPSAMRMMEPLRPEVPSLPAPPPGSTARRT